MPIPSAPRLLALSLALLPVMADTTPALADTAPPRTLAVSGHASVDAVPDRASVVIGVEAMGRTAQGALAQNAAAGQAVIERLVASGIARADLSTSGYQLQANYGEVKPGSTRRPPLLGYTVTTSLTVTVRRIDQVGGLLDAVVDAGATGIDSVSFAVSDPAAKLDEARRAAMADARHRADLYAAAAGTRVGAVQSIQESGGGYAPPPPMAYRAEMKVDAAPSPPVEAGTQSISADVSVTYALE